MTFCHPLVRSALYSSAPLEERQSVHLALAEATDHEADPDRRAWHLAAAAAAPDEPIAVELERSASGAQRRDGLAGAAAFLRRAVALSVDPARRTDRALAGAEASLQAGAFDVAHGLMATAEVGPIDNVQRTRLDLLRAKAAYSESRGAEAPALLLRAAKAQRCDRPELASHRGDPVATTDWALGIEARCRVLLSEGDVAEGLHRKAIERLGRTRLRPDAGRAHLLYGEWLRREHRRVDAREQLRAAHERFTSVGMEAFAERARRELPATGERVRRRVVETRDDLTPQELQIARLASEGLSNPEIGARMFISPARSSGICARFQQARDPLTPGAGERAARS